jgi:hypothetical protein
MSLELITGRAGEAHVDSADVGALIARTLGTDNMVLYKSGIPSMTTANTVHIPACELLMNGRHIRITGKGEDVTIDNGVSGYKRIDLIYLRYIKDSTGVEKIDWYVSKGTQTTGTPSAKTMSTSATILDGASTYYMVIAKVTLDGLTPTIATDYQSNFFLPSDTGSVQTISSAYSDINKRIVDIENADYASKSKPFIKVIHRDFTPATIGSGASYEYIKKFDIPSGYDLVGVVAVDCCT